MIEFIIVGIIIIVAGIYVFKKIKEQTKGKCDSCPGCSTENKCIM